MEYTKRRSLIKLGAGHLDIYAAILLEYRRIRKKNGGERRWRGSRNERRSIMLQFRSRITWNERKNCSPAIAWYGHLGCIDMPVTHFAFLLVVACH